MLVQTQLGFPDTPFVEIPLLFGRRTLVDPFLFAKLSRLHWYAKKSRGRFYACSKVVTDGKVHFLRMHRIVAHTPDGMITHHINGNSLDNRSANLQNMTKWEHAKYFSYW